MDAQHDEREELEEQLEAMVETLDATMTLLRIENLGMKNLEMEEANLNARRREILEMLASDEELAGCGCVVHHENAREALARELAVVEAKLATIPAHREEKADSLRMLLNQRATCAECISDFGGQLEAMDAAPVGRDYAGPDWAST